VQPIFLPVIRRAEPGCSLLPLSQLRVYSQGLLELVYFWGAIPLALLGRRGTRKVYNGRLFCLLLRSMLPIAGIMSDHLATSTWLASIFLNLAALVYVRCTVTSWYHSWAVLLASTNMILAVCIVPMILIAHVSLFEQFKDRVLPLKSGDQKTDADFPSGGPAGTPTRGSECSGPPDESTPWQFQNFWVHVFYLAFQGLVAGPVFLLTAFLAEFASAIDMMLPKAVSTQSCNACFGMEWS